MQSSTGLAGSPEGACSQEQVSALSQSNPTRTSSHLSVDQREGKAGESPSSPALRYQHWGVPPGVQPEGKAWLGEGPCDPVTP